MQIILINSDLLHFYGWWQFSTCLFAFLGLIGIWYHLGRKKGDFGQVWLAFSILCWSISGGIEIYFGSLEEYNDASRLYHSGWRSIFSLLNSLLILFALPWFRHQPKWLGSVIKNKMWYVIVGLPFIFCLLPTISRMITGKGSSLISELDVYYAVLTLLALAFVLWESFVRRGLQWLGYLSIIFILFTLVAQLYKFTDDSNTLILFSAIFKTSLIMIFFALALSWVKDLSETLVLKADQIKIDVLPNSRQQKNKITLSGIEGYDATELSLTSGHYHLMTKFVSARIASPEEGWLEIKPKGNAGQRKEYPINDYNEIKRLLNALLDGLYGKGLWSKDRHGVPFKEAIFEFSKEKGRQIRLKIPVANLTN